MKFLKFWLIRIEIAAEMVHVWSQMKDLYAQMHKDNDVEKIRNAMLPIMQKGDRITQKFKDML